MYIRQPMTAAELIYYIINKIQQLINKHSCIYFFFFTKIYQAPINAITAGPPFIFIQQCAGVLNEVHVLRTQLIYLGADSLEQCGDSNRFIHRHRYITNAELNSIKEGMHTKVPPYFFCIVNAI